MRRRRLERGEPEKAGKYITKIKLKSFQSHIESELILHEGVNIITGRSDSGKSAIIRALLWMISNKPPGKYLRRWGANGGETSVEVSTADGIVITHGIDDAGYYDVTCNGGTNRLKALRTDVPEEVTRLVDLDTFNVQSQLDQHFMIQQSAGSVARELNRLTGLGIVTDMLTEANKRITGINTQMRELPQKISAITTSLERLPDIQLIISKLKQTEALDVSVRDRTAAFSHLQDTCSRTTRVLADLIRQKAARDRLSSVETALSLQERKREKTREWKRLTSICASIRESAAQRNVLVKLSTRYSNILPRAAGLRESIDKRSDGMLGISSLMEKVVKTSAKLEESILARKRVAEEYNKLLAEIGTCPVCGGTLSELRIEV